MEAEAEAAPEVPRLVIVGEGAFADALVRQADVLGWAVAITTDRAESLAAVSRLGANDAVVVQDHEHAVATPVLVAALRGGVGYVGALGSRNMQSARVESLRRAGITDDECAELHCPTGLDLGARTPSESAVSIVAEIIATRSGRQPLALRETANHVSA